MADKLKLYTPEGFLEFDTQHDLDVYLYQNVLTQPTEEELNLIGERSAATIRMQDGQNKMLSFVGKLKQLHAMELIDASELMDINMAMFPAFSALQCGLWDVAFIKISEVSPASSWQSVLTFMYTEVDAYIQLNYPAIGALPS